jgi:hypothetical protein
MDDVILCILITIGLFVCGLYYYCSKKVCSPETNKYYVYAVILFMYASNLYYIIKNYNHYNYNSLVVALLLIIIPVIMYIWKCYQNCYNLFFIVFPSVMIIFNLYVFLFQ